jgi:hypothetical protein
MLGPLHIQYNEHGNRKYLERLVDRVLNWAHVEPVQTTVDRPSTIFVRLEESAIGSDSAAFITDREFGRILLAAPTIYLALPVIYAHRAVVRRWAEPHYLTSYGLMPSGTVVLYTPRDQAELEICSLFFWESYRYACKSAEGSLARVPNEHFSNAISTTQTLHPESFPERAFAYSAAR